MLRDRKSKALAGAIAMHRDHTECSLAVWFGSVMNQHMIVKREMQTAQRVKPELVPVSLTNSKMQKALAAGLLIPSTSHDQHEAR